MSNFERMNIFFLNLQLAISFSFRSNSQISVTVSIQSHVLFQLLAIFELRPKLLFLLVLTSLGYYLFTDLLDATLVYCLFTWFQTYLTMCIEESWAQRRLIKSMLTNSVIPDLTKGKSWDTLRSQLILIHRWLRIVIYFI